MTQEERIYDAVYNIRGRVIQWAVQIESIIDLYIAESFISDENKIIEFVSLFGSRIPFMEKLNIFRHIVDTSRPDFGQAIPNYFNDLKGINEFRNIVAHLPVPFSQNEMDDFDNKGIVTFAKLKTSQKHGLASAIHVSEDWINKLLKSMGDYQRELTKLLRTDMGTASPPA